MAKKKREDGSDTVGLILCDRETGKPLKNRPELIRISMRDLGCSSREPEDYSPMEEIYNIRQSIARSEFIAGAALEAGIILGKGNIPVEEIPEIIAVKHEKNVPKIREIIAEMIRDWQNDPANFGLVSSIDRAIWENMRKHFAKSEGEKNATGQ